MPASEAGFPHPAVDANISIWMAVEHVRGDGQRALWWLAIAFGDDEIHGSEPLLPLGVVAIAHADETVAVLGGQLLRALLTWLRMQRDLRVDSGDGGGGVERAECTGGRWIRHGRGLRLDVVRGLRTRTSPSGAPTAPGT
jgi:hypothetical protein